MFTQHNLQAYIEVYDVKTAEMLYTSNMAVITTVYRMTSQSPCVSSKTVHRHDIKRSSYRASDEYSVRNDLHCVGFVVEFYSLCQSLMCRPTDRSAWCLGRHGRRFQRTAPRTPSQTRLLQDPQMSSVAATGKCWRSAYLFLQESQASHRASGGLTIVPIVQWHGAPAERGPDLSTFLARGRVDSTV